MERSIVGYHGDEEGDWVAELSCGHDQHVRHRPPFQLRPWVLSAEGRAARLGSSIDCPLCDRAELPDRLRLVRTSAEWDEHTMPKGLLRAHRVASGTWGRIAVREGQLRFAAATEPAIEVVLGPGSTQAIPPDVEHEVEPLGAVRFSIDFLAVDRPEPPAPRRAATAGAASPAGEQSDVEAGVPAFPERADEGGDPACWAALLCPECGTVLDGGPHRAGCPAGRW